MAHLVAHIARMKRVPADNRIQVRGRKVRRILFSTEADASELLSAKEQKTEAIPFCVHAKSALLGLD
jgi:hypothetical protein